MSEKSGDKREMDSTPVSMEHFKALESSIENRFDLLTQLIMSKNAIPDSPPPANPKEPKGPMTSTKPSLEDEDEDKGKNLEEGGEDEEIEYIHSQSRKSKGNGSRKFSATPGPSYTGPPLPTPH